MRFARTLASFTLVLLALTALAGARSEAAAPACLGKEPTISSDEPRIEGTEAHDVILAGPGANEIYGLGGNDTICASEGEDVVYGGRGNDRVDGGPGRDRIFGENGNDDLDGAAGEEDTVEGGPGDDRVAGGAGDFDLLVGGAGRDRIDGGPGAHDVASYAAAGGGVQIDLGGGHVSGAEREPLSGVEDALGGSGEDVVVGAAASPNRLDGGPGDDRLVGIGPGDRAYGGPGSDECAGQFAARLSCGAGGSRQRTAVDLYRSIGNTASLVISGSRRANHVVVDRGPSGYVVTSRTPGVGVRLGERGSNACRHGSRPLTILCAGSVDSILASLGPGPDALTVTGRVPASVDAVIDGGGGSDELRGGAGDDTIYAGDDRAPDLLSGGGGHDVLFGINIFHPRQSSGAARMLGGAGNDLLVGGQPCEGDYFEGGPGGRDSASFARVRNPGTAVAATIGGAVTDPDLGGCRGGRIDSSIEQIEGSPGPDRLTGDAGPNWLLGRGGDDSLDGRGGRDRCTGGSGNDSARGCEIAHSIP